MNDIIYRIVIACMILQVRLVWSNYGKNPQRASTTRWVALPHLIKNYVSAPFRRHETHTERLQDKTPATRPKYKPTEHRQHFIRKSPDHDQSSRP